jgi:hypothetical protein
MKSIIERVFTRKAEPHGHRPAAGGHGELSSELSGYDIESYYLRILYDCLRRMMVPPESVDLAVRRVGAGPKGVPSYAAYVRLLRWDPLLAPVLLQNLPVIDARVRKVVGASVILEHTHFEGLWFTAHCETPGAPTALVGVPTQLVRAGG